MCFWDHLEGFFRWENIWDQQLTWVMWIALHRNQQCKSHRLEGAAGAQDVLVGIWWMRVGIGVEEAYWLAAGGWLWSGDPDLSSELSAMWAGKGGHGGRDNKYILLNVLQLGYANCSFTRLHNCQVHELWQVLANLFHKIFKFHKFLQLWFCNVQQGFAIQVLKV